MHQFDSRSERTGYTICGGAIRVAGRTAVRGRAARYGMVVALALVSASPVLAAPRAHGHVVRRASASPVVRGSLTTAYGQVVASGPHAFVLELASGAWLAVNVLAGTSISGPGSLAPPAAGPGPAAIPPGNWVWVQYGHATAGPNATYAAAVIRYSPQPFAVGHAVRVSGSIVGVGPGGFTLTANGHVYTVAVSVQTVVELGGILSALTFVQSGDRVTVQGYLAGSTIVATQVHYAAGRAADGGPGAGLLGGPGNRSGGDKGHKDHGKHKKDKGESAHPRRRT